MSEINAVSSITVRIDFKSPEKAREILDSYLRPKSWIDLCTAFEAQALATDGSYTVLRIQGTKSSTEKLGASYASGRLIFCCRDYRVEVTAREPGILDAEKI